jgi:hypothetical protein
MKLSGFFCIVSGVQGMAAGGVNMMGRFFVLPALMMFGCFGMMFGCFGMMASSMGMMFWCSAAFFDMRYGISALKERARTGRASGAPGRDFTWP